MRRMRLGIWLVVAVLAMASVASAQSTTGTISGRVVDTQERPVPGVTVSVESPNLQGIRTAVTSENGDYIFTLLPSGQYTITFELSGFERAAARRHPGADADAARRRDDGAAGVSETVEVVGRAADVLTQTAQVATNFPQELIANLPTNRDINATMLLAPSVHPTGSRRELLDRRLDVVREPVHGQRRHGQREPARPGRTTCTSRTRSRRRRSRPPASRPSTAGSAAASST